MCKKMAGLAPGVSGITFQAVELMIDIVADQLTRNLGGWNETKKARLSFFFANGVDIWSENR